MTLRPCNYSEGLTTRTILYRICSYHSSVVKVLSRGWDSRRRKFPMMGLCDRGVKPPGPSVRCPVGVSPGCLRPLRRREAEYYPRPWSVSIEAPRAGPRGSVVREGLHQGDSM